MVDISYKDLKFELEFNNNELFYNNIKLQHISQSSKGLNKDVYCIESLFDNYNVIDIPQGYQLKKFISITKLVNGINTIKGNELISKIKTYNYNKNTTNNYSKIDKTYILNDEDTKIVEIEQNKINEYNEQIKILSNKIVESNEIIKNIKLKYEQQVQHKKLENYINNLDKNNLEYLLQLLQNKQNQ